ncbi:hypothetical protein E8E13_001353 [Curvularia kusanoi]|uniref:Transcription factor domain-containing protein n=1 Tax=Curvularia kusanoi TaxID=90978 RepID=A0A9P4T4E1_CURKU|nr:hypothetical protein E8E13_001353 [Curvularia kusanoi]
MRFHGVAAPTPRIDDAEEAVRLLNWFLYSTSGYLDLFDLERVRAELVAWIASSQEGSNLQSAIFYLVLAIGAQTYPNGLDLMADEYFNYGRHLGLGYAMAEANHATLQYLSLVSAYLMGQSLMHAAFIQIGSAVRAALVLGLHRQKATTDDTYEARMCKRIWKTVRSQDLFLSSILGQPITAKHHHETARVADCSATADICNILEDVLTKIYGGGARPDDVIESIISHHQTCLGQFDDGLENDGLGLSEYDEHHRPHIGVCHIKHGSYANIQLLTMPFLLRKVLRRPYDAQPSINLCDISESSFSNEFMAFGCIDAAISLVGLFRKFLDADQIPKRLPMVVYAMFYVALSLGLAVFGDLDSIFPLQENIQTASELLAKLAKHDWLAKRYAIIIGQMQTACRTYVRNRLKTATGAHRARVQQLFGTLELPKDNHRQDRACVVPQEVDKSQTLTPLSTVSQSNQPSMDSIEQRRIDVNAPADESFSSHQIFGQGVGEELSTSARGLLSSLAEGDLPYGAQLWDSIWFDEHFT